MRKRVIATGAKAIVILALVAVLGNTVYVSPVARDMTYRCKVCGAKRLDTQRLLGNMAFTHGQPTHGQVETTGLERWIVSKTGPHTHEWGASGGYGRNVFGQAVGSISPGNPPDIDVLSVDTINAFARRASDEQISAFLDTMSHGDWIQTWEMAELAGRIADASGSAATTSTSPAPSHDRQE